MKKIKLINNSLSDLIGGVPTLARVLQNYDGIGAE